MGASRVESVTCTFSGSSRAVPFPSVRPPPGIAAASEKVAGLVKGHATRWASIVTSPRVRVVAGETSLSSKVRVPLANVKRSKLSFHCAAAGGGGGGSLGAAAVSPVRSLTTSIVGSAPGAKASRSIRPPASRTTRISAPPTSIAPSAMVCATASACVSPTVSLGIRRNGPGWPR
jgi:hypothetical protein